jgi:hypothetical protein
MIDRAVGQGKEPPAPQRLNRILYSLIIASFFLPFATVRSCMGGEGEGTSYTGIELLAEEAGVLLLGVLLLAALLLAYSFRHRVFTVIQQGLLSASKALLCAIAILTTFFATGMTFMFSRVSLHVGFFVCVGSWLVLEVLLVRAGLLSYSLSRTECRERPPPWGAVVGVVAVVVCGVSVWRSEPNGALELAVGLLTGVLLGAPLVVLALLFAVWYRCRTTEAVSSRTTHG